MTLVSLNCKPDYDMPAEMGYCPSLYLSEEQCEALGINGSIDAGTVIGMTIRCLVKSSTTSVDSGEEGEADGSPDVSLRLEVTDAEITAAPSATSNASAAKSLYGSTNSD
jgi:hypothetical protein